MEQQKQPAFNAFWGASLHLKRYPINFKNKDYICCVSKRDLKPNIIEYSDFYEKLNILTSFAQHNKLYSLNYVDTQNTNPEEKEFFPSLYIKTQNFIRCFTNGCKKLLNEACIKYIYFYYPFIRISLINNFPLITYFSLIQFYNGERVFCVFEEIPDSVAPENYNNYFKGALTDIRQSDFVINKIYSYFSDKSENSKGITINYFYKLDTLICREFGIPIDILKKDKFIIAKGKLSQTSNTHKQIFYLNEDFIEVAIAEKDYNFYMKKAIGVFPDLIVSEYAKYKFQQGIDCYSEDLSYKFKLKLFAKILYDFNSKYKIDVGYEAQQLIQAVLDPNPKNINDIINDISGAVGAFAGEFLKNFL